MKALATSLAMASATLAIPPGAYTAMPSASAHAEHPLLVSGYRVERSGSSSRPDRLAGEISPYSRLINFSAGSFSVGDYAAISLHKDTGLLTDILVGAALLLQSNQSPLDREIQSIVSSNFETYWD